MVHCVHHVCIAYNTILFANVIVVIANIYVIKLNSTVMQKVKEWAVLQIWIESLFDAQVKLWKNKQLELRVTHISTLIRNRKRFFSTSTQQRARQFMSNQSIWANFASDCNHLIHEWNWQWSFFKFHYRHVINNSSAGKDDALVFVRRDIKKLATEYWLTWSSNSSAILKGKSSLFLFRSTTLSPDCAPPSKPGKFIMQFSISVSISSSLFVAFASVSKWSDSSQFSRSTCTIILLQNLLPGRYCDGF